jgi:hypothetical protein
VRPGYGQRLVSPREWFDPVVKGASLKGFTWHCLRHSFAPRRVMAGVDLRTVQRNLTDKTAWKNPMSAGCSGRSAAAVGTFFTHTAIGPPPVPPPHLP